jgi:malate dehydrogenase
VSMAVPTDGSYGIEEGIISSFACTCSGGEYSIVEGLEVNEFAQQRIDASVGELKEERAAVEKLSLV